MKSQEKVLVSKPTFWSRVIRFHNFLVIILLAFGVLTFIAKQNAYFSIDVLITNTVQSFNPVWFDQLMIWISRVGNGYWGPFVMGLICLPWVLTGRYKETLVLIISGAGSTVLAETLKAYVSRPRPNAELIIQQVGEFIRSDSFPSGHVLFYMGMFGFLLFLAFTELKKVWMRNLVIGVCSFFIGTVGISRIYLGAHWFSDVLGAYLIGIVWLWLMIWLYRRLNPKLNTQ
jgi:undecaprenyl-diphosphatase